MSTTVNTYLYVSICVRTHVCIYICTSCMSVCVRVFILLPHRLDMIVGPQPLGSRAKTFSSPFLPLYYSQGRKNSTQGSECPNTSNGFSFFSILFIHYTAHAQKDSRKIYKEWSAAFADTS